MKAHLDEVIERRIPVSLIYQGKHFPACRLMRLAGDEGSLTFFVDERADTFTPDDILSASYNFGSYIYTFETEIMQAEPTGEGTALTLRSPGQIARLERRKSYRVAPSRQAPVKMVLSSPDSRMIAEAKDIGNHGVAFLAPPGTPSLVPGTGLNLLIELPSLGTVAIDGIVRSRRTADAGGATQYGVEFTPPVEFDSPLAQYVHWRRLEIHDARNPESGSKPRAVLVAIKETPDGTIAFACSSLAVRSITDFSAFSQIVSADVIDFLEDKTPG